MLRADIKGKALRVVTRLWKKSGVKSRGFVIIDAIELYNKLDKLADEKGHIVIQLKNKQKLLCLPRKKEAKRNIHKEE